MCFLTARGKHGHLSSTFFSISAALEITTCLFRGTRRKGRRGQWGPAINTQLEAQQDRCLDAFMSWYFWQQLAIWNFKPWRVLYFSTMKRYILRSNFSCLQWRKTLPGSKYLNHQNGMHPSRANWIWENCISQCAPLCPQELLHLQSLSSLSWNQLVLILGSTWYAPCAPLSSPSLHSYD